MIDAFALIFFFSFLFLCFFVEQTGVSTDQERETEEFDSQASDLSIWSVFRKIRNIEESYKV